jgi:hypothetical protein
MSQLNRSKVFLIAFTLTLLGVPAMAQSLPTPDRNGDYMPKEAASQELWMAVDSDPKGLNCRGNIPPYKGSEQVLTTFKKDQTFTAVAPVRGIERIALDDKGKPWLRVQLNDNKECWVRANRRLVSPSQ